MPRRSTIEAIVASLDRRVEESLTLIVAARERNDKATEDFHATMIIHHLIERRSLVQVQHAGASMPVISSRMVN